jgi:large subunit ribosomal protein L25
MAEQFSITGEKREALGTRVSRRLRKSGKIPAVLARKGEEPVHLQLDAKEFLQLVKKHARIINLQHPAGKDKVFIKEVQYDHLDEHAIHVDFTKIAMDQVLTIEVPLILKGKPVGVTEEGGVLDQYVKVLKIQVLPDAIPDHIEADVANLKKDVKLQIKDLVLPPGVKVTQDPELLVAIVQEHKVEEVAPAAVAAGPVEPEVIKKPKETEEGAEGEAAAKAGDKKDAAPKKDEKKKEDKK